MPFEYCPSFLITEFFPLLFQEVLQSRLITFLVRPSHHTSLSTLEGLLILLHLYALCPLLGLCLVLRVGFEPTGKCFWNIHVCQLHHRSIYAAFEISSSIKRSFSLCFRLKNLSNFLLWGLHIEQERFLFLYVFCLFFDIQEPFYWSRLTESNRYFLCTKQV